ncbi:MAG: CHAT domain-containing protein [Bryobacterales bacterium]|nr:CHAT domain-containing protein [Bryobacterales bacterium]
MLCFAWIPLAAQNRPIDRALRNRGFEAARDAAQKRLDAALEAGKQEDIANLRLALGHLYVSANRAKDAWRHLEAGWIAAAEQTNTAALKRGWPDLRKAASDLGDQDLAYQLVDRTLLNPEHPRLPQDRVKLLLDLVAEEPKPRGKLPLFDRAARVASESKDNLSRGQVLLMWGDACYMIADLSCALMRLKEAETATTNAGLVLWRADVLARLSRVYFDHHQYDLALSYIDQALTVVRQMRLRQRQIRYEQFAGRLLLSMSRRDAAIERFERALAVARTMGFQQKYLQLTALAYAYGELGETERARVLIEESEALGQVVRMPQLNAFLANTYLKLGKTEEAIQRATRALGVLSARGGDLHMQFTALRARAFAYAALGDSEHALTDALRAIAMLEDVAATIVPADFMRRGFFQTHTQLVDLALPLLMKADRSEQALEVAETNRGRAFMQLLASRDRNARILDFEDLESVMASADPGLATDANVPALKAAQIRETARKVNSVILSYYVSPEVLYLWAITPSGGLFTAQRKVTPAKLSQLVGRARAKSDRPDREALRDLYALLIQPVQKALTPNARLAVVPHGPLLDLPFSALLDDTGRYLIESHAIHQAYSSGVLAYLGAREAETTPNYLVVAAPQRLGKVGTRTLPLLPASRQEADSIARAVSTVPVQLLTGAQATATEVRKAMEGKSVIHFATHAVVDAQNPLESFLALSDGTKLTAAEIQVLPLRVELVVLSACRSAAGAISADGVLGLTRAFFSAGAARVVASSWDVSDATAARLIASFHAEYRRGKDKAAALRTAQLRLLKDLREGRVSVETPAGPVTLPEHPVLWAGFLLHGLP